MTYRKEYAEISSRIGEIEVSLLETLKNMPTMFDKFTIDPDMIMNENVKKIIKFAKQQGKFDMQQIIAESKLNSDFVDYSYIENFLERDTGEKWQIIPYQKEIAQNYITMKTNELNQNYKNVNNIAEIEKYIHELTELKNMQYKTRQSISEEADSMIYDFQNGIPKDTFLKTGYNHFDNLTGYLKKKSLNVIGANSGMGKSAFAINLMWQLAKNGAEVHYFSLEMTQREILERLLAIITKITLNDIKSYEVSNEQREQLEKALKVIKKSGQIEIDDNSNTLTSDIRNVAIRETNRPKVIIVDHIIRMKAINTKQDRRLQIADIAVDLKNIAKDTNTVVIALAQLNRGNKNRQDKRPTMSDLQESGNIEQESDTVMLIHREDYHDKDLIQGDVSPTKLIIDKNRSGPQGVIDMSFYKGVQTFYED